LNIVSDRGFCEHSNESLGFLKAGSILTSWSSLVIVCYTIKKSVEVVLEAIKNVGIEISVERTKYMLMCL